MPASSGPSAPVRPNVIPKVNGAVVSPELVKDIISIEVDLSVDIPDMAILRLSDSALNDTPHLTTIVGWLGKPLEITFSPFNQAQISRPLPPEPVFKGEVVGVEPGFEENGEVTILVRAYDKRHRLNRETKTRAFLQVTASDIITKLAQENGLTAQVTATTVQYQSMLQRNQTDLEFINHLARLNGFEVRINDQQLIIKPPANTTSVDVTWGDDLRSFYPRLSLAGQVNEVKVKAWDLKQNQPIVGAASTSSAQPTIGFGKSGGVAAQSAFAAAKVFEVQLPMENQSEATKVATAILNSINMDFIEAEGTAFGNPKLKPGAAANVKQVGTTFNGKYIITSATHIYTSDADYQTHFRVEGTTRKLMSDLLTAGESATNQIPGLAVAVVTNIQDDEGLGRVKVKYPWLSGTNDQDIESFWAPVVSVGAGPNTGLFWLPEVNDTVLIAFEHGNVNRPFVLGGIWNSKAAPPVDKNKQQQSGKVLTRALQTTSGHKILFTDSDSDSKMQIIDKASVTTITLDAQNKAATIDSQGKGTFKTSQAMTIESNANISMKSSGGNVDIQSSGGNLTIKGVQVTVEASGTLTLKGATVNIN
ncbi:MAG: VgrG-related protein [Anaerolineae bacterium]|nr:VgrG-related protein [Anaerolineae bacterium]